jgi:anhydro-N-acetylmuramic acid kinase
MAAELFLGMMSGTSMDGIDVALIKTNGVAFVESVASSFYPYSDACKRCLKYAERIMHAAQGDVAVAERLFAQHEMQQDNAIRDLFLAHQLHDISLASLIVLSTYLHEAAAQQLLHEHRVASDDISLVGYHGQTLYHAPHLGITQQIGAPQLLADRLNVPVVADFRSNDIQHGGQGAPLTPIYHWALALQEGLVPLAVVNCGGIANISFVLGEDTAQLFACDTGPGNVLLDRFVRNKTAQKYFFDQDGLWSLQGEVNQRALDALRAESLPQYYLQQTPPKSLDSNDCQLPALFNQLSLQEGCATLAFFSVECMIQSLDFCTTLPTRFVLAGGGWYNAAILDQFKVQLTQRLKKTPQILNAKQLGWQQDTLEAEAFAYLAKRVICQLPLSFPNTTGVRQPVTGGKVFYPQNKENQRRDV